MKRPQSWIKDRNTYGRIQGRAGVALRKRRLDSEPLCRDCKAKGLVTEATTIDHILALSNGGTDTDDNCAPLCDECHRVKTNRDLGFKEKRRFGLDGWPEQE